MAIEQGDLFYVDMVTGVVYGKAPSSTTALNRTAGIPQSVRGNVEPTGSVLSPYNPRRWKRRDSVPQTLTSQETLRFLLKSEGQKGTEGKGR